LDSGRIGLVQNFRSLSQKFFYDIEPGRYNDFYIRTEVLLIDTTGRYFTLFRRYLSLVMTRMGCR